MYFVKKRELAENLKNPCFDIAENCEIYNKTEKKNVQKTSSCCDVVHLQAWLYRQEVMKILLILLTLLPLYHGCAKNYRKY